MRHVTFKSVLDSNKAYELSSDYDYNRKGNAPLSMYLRQFETFGDGITKHSPSWAVQWQDITDLCISLTSAIVADPQNEAWGQLHYILFEGNDELIEFALTIKYREGKAQYYNLGDRKLSTSESKRYDKRWERVETWHDGSPKTALSIILNHQSHLDWLGKLCWADDLRRKVNYCDWEELFKPVADLKGDWHQAFLALRSAARAIVALDYARRANDSAVYNSTPKPEVAQVAA